jgi:hypothetical protein
VLSGRGLCDELITHPEESYRLWRVVVCDLETSSTRRLKPATGLENTTTVGCNSRKTNKQTNRCLYFPFFIIVSLQHSFTVSNYIQYFKILSVAQLAVIFVIRAASVCQDPQFFFKMSTGKSLKTGTLG